jgi:hypothetical protein
MKTWSWKFFVIPMEAGIQKRLWTTAFAGVTVNRLPQDFHVPL